MALLNQSQVPTQVIYFVFNEPVFDPLYLRVLIQRFAERAAHYSAAFLFVKFFFKLI